MRPQPAVHRLALPAARGCPHENAAVLPTSPAVLDEQGWLESRGWAAPDGRVNMKNRREEVDWRGKRDVKEKRQETAVCADQHILCSESQRDVLQLLHSLPTSLFLSLSLSIPPSLSLFPSLPPSAPPPPYTYTHTHSPLRPFVQSRLLILCSLSDVAFPCLYSSTARSLLVPGFSEAHRVVAMAEPRSQWWWCVLGGEPRNRLL